MKKLPFIRLLLCILLTFSIVSCDSVTKDPATLNNEENANTQKPDDSQTSGDSSQNTDNSKNETQWLLPKENFISAKQPMHAIFPRPDSETSNKAYHRNAYPGIMYEIPLGVAFGAYPFYYEIVKAPEGTTIGAQFDDTNYGIIKWTPDSDDSGEHTFKIKVHDQDANELNITWTVNVNKDWIIFADSVNGSDTSGYGTLAQPYKSLAYSYTQAEGRAICLRGGSYFSTDKGYSLNETNTRTVFAYPGETVNISGAGNNDDYGVFTWNTSDCWMAGFRLHSLQNSADKPRWTYTSSVVNRVYQYRIYFDGGSIGKGIDNVGCNIFGNPGTGLYRDYAMQSHCEFNNLPYAENGFASFDLYQTNYFLHQNNTYSGTLSDKSRYCAWVKAWDVKDVCIRANRTTDSWSGNFLSIALTSGQERIEVCYNTFKSDFAENPDKNNILVLYGYNYWLDGLHGPIWTYRNTFYGEVCIMNQDYSAEFSFENDIVIHNQTFPDAAHKIMMYDSNFPSSLRANPADRNNITLSITGAECHGDTYDGIIDQDLLLKGNYRSSWLGKRGAEISR